MLLLPAALLATTLTAQTLVWPVQRMHTPSSSLQRLSEAERQTVMKLIRPELGPLFQGDAPAALDQAIRSFRAERINIGASAVALLPASGELCGTTGNCSFWIVDLTHRRVLLHTDAIQSFAVDVLKPHTMPIIYTNTHNSTAESEMIRWHYIDGRYARDSCATLNNADDSGAPLKESRITPHPCNVD